LKGKKNKKPSKIEQMYQNADDFEKLLIKIVSIAGWVKILFDTIRDILN